MQSQEIKSKERSTPDLAKVKKGLTVSLFIGDKPIETLTTEQRERMAEKLSKTMSIYYSSHTSEYNQIQRG